MSSISKAPAAPAPAVPRPALIGDLTRLVPYALAIAFVLVLPSFLGNDNDVRLAALIAIYAIAAIGMNVALGYASLLTLAQGASMGLGAYAWTLLVAKAHLDGVLALLVTPLICASVGALIGAASARVTGHYFIVVTVAAQVGIMTIISAWASLTGGTQGFAAVPMLTVGGLNTLQPRDLLVIAGVVLVIVLYLAQRLRASRAGRALVTLGESDSVARAAGVRVAAYRALAMAICGAFAGLAGALYAPYTGFLGPESFGIGVSILVLTMVVLGGLGSNIGAIVGAIVVTVIQDRTQTLAEVATLIYGALVIFVVVVAPGGLVGLISRGWHAAVRAVGRRSHG
jgi:branched-chain amino acid transport system permease protein